jgi:hypothetical protein
MSNEFVRGQRGTIKGRPWGMKPGTKGRISRVFKPGQGSGYDAEFRAKGWQPMRVNKGEVDFDTPVSAVTGVAPSAPAASPPTERSARRRYYGYDEQSVYNDRASAIVEAMLEGDYDAHVKAHERVQKWDKAHGTYQDLARKKAQAQELFTQLGTSIGYERALAHVGLNREDVSHQIYGAQIGSIDNYKKTRPAKVCQQPYCGAGRRPQTGEACSDCGEPLADVEVPLSFSDLHRNYARHILGVETNDGRRVWFDEPVPPRPAVQSEEPAGRKTLPNRPGRFGTGARGGSWDITKGV